MPLGTGTVAGVLRLPDVYCQAAFGVDPYVTPAAGDWVTLGKVEGAKTDSGREIEEGRIKASTVHLVIRNDDRSLDPNNTASSYYPNVVPGTHLRVVCVWALVQYPLFTGYVEDWPQTYESSFSARVDLDASDAFALFARIKLRPSLYALEVAKDNPTAWLRLGESSGTVATDSSGNGHNGQYQANGTPPQGTMGATSLIAGDPDKAFAPLAGQRCSILDKDLVTLFPFSVEFWAGTAQDRSIQKTLFAAYDSAIDISQMIALWCNNSMQPRPGELEFRLQAGAGVLSAWSGRQFDDGFAHHVVVQVNSGLDVRIIVDGLDTTTGITGFSGLPDQLRAGWAIGNTPATVYGDFPLIGNIDEFAVYNGVALSTARIYTHYLSGGIGLASQTTGERLDTILDSFSWPSGARAIDTGNTTLTTTSLSGSLLDHMQLVGEAEDGLLFVDGAGKVTLVERHAMLGSPYTVSQGTFGDTDAETYSYENVEPSAPAHYIRNEIKVTPEGGPPQYAIDTTSSHKYGSRNYERGPLPVSTSQAKDAASWLLSRYKDPHPRFKSMTLSPIGAEDTMYPQMLARRLGDLVTVVRRPPGGGPATTVVCRIEGISHDFTGRSWLTTWKLAPSDPVSDWWVLGTSALGSSRLAY